MTAPIYKKNNDQSASKIGQYVHDYEPVEHDGIDIDHVVWKSERRCLRVIEEKLPGEQIRRSQERILPLMANLIELGKRSGLLSDDSGVFVLYWWQSSESPVVDTDGHLCATFKIRRVTSDGIGRAECISSGSVRDLVCGRDMTETEATDGR